MKTSLNLGLPALGLIAGLTAITLYSPYMGIFVFPFAIFLLLNTVAIMTLTGRLIVEMPDINETPEKWKFIRRGFFLGEVIAILFVVIYFDARNSRLIDTAFLISIFGFIGGMLGCGLGMGFYYASKRITST